jgi:hypothetical protein
VAVAEIARVLRPGGVLCLVWNEGTEPSPLPPDYRAYIDTLQAPTLDFVRSGPTAAEVLAGGPFAPVQTATVLHEQLQDRDGVLDFARSVSWIAHRPEQERAQIMRKLDSLLGAGPYAFPMKAEVSWTVRT